MNIQLRHHQSGFSLMEVLVALLIFSLGLLGAAGLQLSSIRSAQFSNQSVVATQLAREYGEIMQMLPAATSSTSSTGTVAFFMDTNGVTPAASNPCAGSAVTCAPADLVSAMQNDWIRRVQTQLPAGRAEVCRDSSPRGSDGVLKTWADCDDTGSMVVIKLGWSAKKPQGLDTSNAAQTWATDTTRPQFAVTFMGNLMDYVSP